MEDPRGSETIYHPREHCDGDLYDTNSTSTTNATIHDTIPDDPTKEQMVVKIGILGDQDVGKSSFMRRYVCEEFNQHSSYGYYNNSPGSVLFLEKHISMKQVNLFLGLWCSTTYSLYESALQLVCKDANVIIFMFSLTNKRSLNNIKSYYDQALTQNKQFIPILVGTKYDIINSKIQSNNIESHKHLNDYHKITKIARKFAMKMKASLIYISSKTNININHIIKVCVAKVFNIKPKLKEYHWNTLKALREHHVNKILKVWSNQKKMKYLIYGFIKTHNINHCNLNITNNNIINTLIKYIQYDLQPLSSHHNEGKKHSHSHSHTHKKSSKKHRHKKISTKSTKHGHKSTKKHTHKKSSKKHKKKSKKHRKSSHIKHRHKPPESPILNQSINQYSDEGCIMEGAIKL